MRAASISANNSAPISLAWVGSMPSSYCELSYALSAFEDSDDFLLALNAFDFDFFVIALAQRGVQGLDLIRLVRRRSSMGILAVAERSVDVVASLDAGADMVLFKGAPSDHMRAAISAVRRRVVQGSAVQTQPWKLVESRALLVTPEGRDIPLSDSDLAILQCFAAHGGKVDRKVLVERLWGPDATAMDNALHATLYRLRKRIERRGQAAAPVYAVSKEGYEFRALLITVNLTADLTADWPATPCAGSNTSRKSR